MKSARRLVSDKTKQFAVQKNSFDTPECTQSNQNKQRKQIVLVGCMEGVKSILDAVKFPCYFLIKPASFCLTQPALAYIMLIANLNDMAIWFIFSST